MLVFASGCCNNKSLVIVVVARNSGSNVRFAWELLDITIMAPAASCCCYWTCIVGLCASPRGCRLWGQDDACSAAVLVSRGRETFQSFPRLKSELPTCYKCFPGVLRICTYIHSVPTYSAASHYILGLIARTVKKQRATLQRIGIKDRIGYYELKNPFVETSRYL